MKKFISILMLVAFVTCGIYATGSKDDGVIVIDYPTAQVGVNTSAPVVKELVKTFNQKYEGQYRVEVEEIPGDANYIEKLKVMLAGGELPPVIYGMGYNLLDIVLGQDMLVDLTDRVYSDPDWVGMYDPQTLETNTRNGKLYGISSDKSVIGYYYNKDLFAKAGIKAPAKTWDEFFAQCDTLLAAGITPLALDTADSAWITSLWFGAMTGTASKEGYDFIQQMLPTNYNIPEFIDAMEKIQMMFQKYTTVDAVGGKYEHAANNFLSGQVAMIANGSWMMPDFQDLTKTTADFVEKVGVAAYPGNFIYSDPMQGYLVVKNDDPKVVEASIAFVKHMTSNDAQRFALETQGMLPCSTSVEVTDVAREKFPLLADIVTISTNAEYYSRYTQSTMYSNLLDVISRELPRLANGEISAEDFANILTEEAKKNL